MSELRFAEPQWIHALWVVLAFAVLLLLSGRSSGRALGRLVAPSLVAVLVRRATPGQRRVRIALLTLAALFGVLALMRPQWGLSFVSTPRASAELMVAVDVSRSMLAEDVVPNRLERAKAEVRDLLGFLEGDHIGLIAFAGRASVLAPLTPDFGFFRLVLDELGPHSVTRGGTRLEEPIRKALAGFRATGDVSRALLLITDGEDQDSFPLAAAREAAERGIAIIAIGLGSEAGSEIPLLDRETGARSLLRDAEGRAVQSRLDGATLREIARLTGGAYVPAGTAALDLESIYHAHIAGLMRGRVEGEGRPVRTEGFQWPVLAALLSLIGAALAGRAREVAATALVLTLVSAPTASRAQEELGESPTPAAEMPAPGGETPAPEPPRESLAPRAAYNLALESLGARELEEARHLFEIARTAAGTDGETRYRATYGLGWLEAAGADARLESEPAEALSQLALAADRFRDSLRLRPGSEDARHNLEVVLERARVLADSLRDPEGVTLATRLDELAQRQRELVGGVRSTLALPEAAAELPASRTRFRDLSSRQRLILSDGDALAGEADAERLRIEAKPAEEQQPEEQLRAVQLGQLLHYLQRARERMGHARRELRQRRPERAHRRAAVALHELKRARDQLRDPVEVLAVLLGDAVEVGLSTQLYAMSGAAVPGTASPQERPDWLTVDYLRDALDSLTGRTAELRARLAAVLPPGPAGPPPDLDPESRRLLAAARQAEPLVGSAAESFARAGAAIERDASVRALVAERDGVAALSAARELFLDLRGLIETAYADQLSLAGALAPGRSQGVNAREIAAQLRPVQRTNLARAARISGLLDEQLDALPPEASDVQAQQQRERLLHAKSFVTLAGTAMSHVMRELGRPGRRAPPDLEGAVRPNARAVRGLENLRRLFFSIVEQLRDTARRQQELNDVTERVAGAADPAPALGPLIPHQAELADTAGKLASALEEQSRQSPGRAGAEAGELRPELEQDLSDRLRRSAELTLAAAEPMQSAAEDLARRELESARTHQDRGLAHLLEAVALLTPPEAGQGEPEPQDSDSQGEDGQSADAGAKSSPRSVDPAQLLQEVRDREARRRRERGRQRRAGYETVEKDW